MSRKANPRSRPSGQGDPHLDRPWVRSRALDIHWENGRLVCENFVRQTRAEINADAVALLESFAKPIRPRRLGELGFSAADLRRVVRQWARLGFLLPKPDPVEGRIEAWQWGHAARHFLFGTRDAHRHVPVKDRLAYSKQLARSGRQPSLYKNYSKAHRLPLDNSTAPASAVNRSLAGLRSCRDFRRALIPQSALAELLHLTWGEQGKIDTRPFPWGRLVEKTSYSAGYRNPIEVYPVVTAVEGLRPGLYHYSVRDHALEFLRPGRFAGLMRRVGAGQEWIRSASVYFLMTAVLDRTMFKYRHDFALRAVFGDAGHLSQSLHVAAAGLGLGAASTYALDHSRAEEFLGVDSAAEPFVCLSVVGIPRKGAK